jgi:phenylpropionate dioxygenase-like ring-hydroxylating dioxygenase large terminal subunit
MSIASKSSGPVSFTKITADRRISPEYMLQERDKLWAKTRLVTGVAQDVAEPRDFFVFELQPESIIISRTQDGTLNAFYNVCQHRGATLLLTEQGAMATYTSPYHVWVYNKDGSLREVPEEDRFSRGVPKGRAEPPDTKSRSLGWSGLSLHG